MDSEILKYVLSSQGSVDRGELECNLGDAAFIAEIIGSSDKLVACSFNGAARVVARSKVRLCRTKECPGCGELHLCKNFLFSGACHLLQSRRGCSFSHDLHTEYNLEVLREFGVESLNRTELCLLLLQSNALLPQICHDYNNSCGCWVACQRLHVCERFLRGESCGCTRAHDFSAPQPLQLLREKHVPANLFQLLKSVYVNKEALRLAEKGKGASRGDARASSDANDECELSDVSQEVDSDSSSTVSANQNQSRDGGRKKTRGGKNRKRNRQKTKAPSAAAAGCGQNVESFQDPNTAAETCEGYNSDSSSTLSTGQSKENRSGFCASSVGDVICMFFIRGHCKHEDNCQKVHDAMPYRWQIKQGAFWIPMAENETIEKDFCDPQKTYSSTCPPVCFNTMRSGHYKVRRQSTVNSVAKPNYSHTTDWLWFWEHENGQWYQYTSRHRLTSTSSKKIEENYVKNNKDVVMFKAGSQSHLLSFQDMTETNLTNGTIRHVRRRPRFVSAAEVQNKRQSSTNIAAVPFYFNTSNAFLTFEQLQLTQLTQLTTAASTTKQYLQQNISPAAATTFATANISTKTSEKSLLGLPYLQTTTKPVNTVSSTKPQTASTQQATNVTSTTNAATDSVNTFSTTSRSQMTPTTTKSQSTFTTPQTTSANFEFTTPAAATKHTTTSTFTFASTTGSSLANEFSSTTSTSGLKSSNQASQMALNVSQTSTAVEFPSLAAATKLTTGTTTSSEFTFPTTSANNTSSAFSPFAKSSNPCSATSSADRSQMTPTTSATAQFTSSTLKTSGFTSSNPILTDLTPSKLEVPVTAMSTKSQFTFATTATPTSPTSHFSSSALSTSGLKSPTSQPMTSQATKSQITFATTATPTSPTSHFSSSTLSTSGLKSPTSQPMTSQAMNSQITFATSAAASKSATSPLTFSTTAGTNSPHAFSTSSTKPQAISTFAVKSQNPFSPTLSADRSQITPTTSSTAQFTPSTLKTSGLKPSNQFSTGITPPKSEATTATSAAKLQSTLSTTSGTNSPNAFSISSSNLKSKAASASSAAALATTSQLQSPIRSPTATAASSAAKPPLRSQTSSTARPEFELPTYSTTSSAFAANSPKAFSTTAMDSTASAVGTSSTGKPRATPTKNEKECIIL